MSQLITESGAAEGTESSDDAGGERFVPRARQQRLVEVVVPVHNEEQAVDGSVRRLHSYLTGTFPYAFRPRASMKNQLAYTLRVLRT